jgi:hypothetical protein
MRPLAAAPLAALWVATLLASLSYAQGKSVVVMPAAEVLAQWRPVYASKPCF